ncbi:MAG: hypothetical protein WCA46_30180, partial [Actinocatenispora sp.]
MRRVLISAAMLAAAVSVTVAGVGVPTVPAAARSGHPTDTATRPVAPVRPAAPSRAPVRSGTRPAAPART